MPTQQRSAKRARFNKRIKRILLSEESVTCQIDLRGRGSKPATLPEYGALRDLIIQSEWVTLGDDFFIGHVTRRGCPFYGCLFNGRDLMETGSQKAVWRIQTIVGLDFDKCEIEPEVMLDHYRHRGYEPWLVYRTFSDGELPGRCYRMLWKVEPDLNMSYEDVSASIKSLARFSHGHADKKCHDPSRLWQGSTKGTIYYAANAAKLNMRKVLLECSSLSMTKATPGMV
jgi:hypothetical protein